ncbi:transcriptional regulator [Streptomyces sp. V2]|uniref:Winged helix-turn-helix transcriptional regulator n=1 Tax=Streptomyces niveiscabiei TaxID=164115 RepID=A0ABW9HL20_9ACTN|nr:helix-turn-helix domain-containing protein [Streptomyces sp. V2]PWG15045.1 transcriptional regulator [Streptomyces sp. V2]
MEITGGSGGAAAAGPCAHIPAEHMQFIRQVLDRVGDKWSLLLITVVETGPLRYTDLQRQIPGISQRMLTLTLRQLHEDGLITRTAYAEVPPRVEYSLTPLGRGLHEIATSLIGWATDHHDEIRAHRARAATPAARS